ncbi:MAG TPA: phosphotransferase [Thermomicrobiales bacterium]|jgi:Ser/Thr protein kinase RdoA (MazF antagonist)|nr:phosphotransferase [Thermomicrobiales bacterium]
MTDHFPALLSRHWPLTSVRIGPTLQAGAGRRTIAIRADQGAFILKVYEDHAALGLVSPGDGEIDRRLSILDHLAARGTVPAPRLLHARSDARFIRAAGQTHAVMEHIPGDRPPDTPETWAELGRIVAALNADTAFPHPYGIPVRDTIQELTAQAAAYPFASDFRALVETLAVVAEGPTGLVHGEVNLANVIQSPGGRFTLIDWDHAGTGPTVLDAGYPLITTFLTEDLVFRQDLATAFYQACIVDPATVRTDAIFAAALLHALRYVRFGDTLRRWARIRHALAHRDELLSVIPGHQP